jgi:glycerophosphoryl diester phosphodiesterase
MVRVGHRGAAGHAPENTLLAIEHAISLHADYVELDVQRTRDGSLVLMHDKRVDRTTNGVGYVADMDLAALRELHAGSGQSIPTVDEVLALSHGHIGLMLEMIQPGLADQLYDTVRMSGYGGKVIYASFHHADVRRINMLDEDAASLALLEGVPVQPAQFAIDARAAFVGIAMDSITMRFVHDLHAASLNVFVYTVNDPRDIRQAHALGVDGIISDYPDRI